MNKLKNKTFWVLFVLINFFSITLLFIFNFHIYQNEKEEMLNDIERVSKFKYPFSDRIPMFMDTSAYVVYFDFNNVVNKIVSYSSNGLSNEEVAKLAVDYMNKKNKPGMNLYVNKYIYSVNSNNSLIILDNTESRLLVNGCLRVTLIVFILFEIVNLSISLKLTRWIVKPVIDAFDSQKQFIYDVSHELKTPIAVIMANADMVDKNPEEKKWVNNIKNESDRMSKLVVSLLDLLMSDNINQKEKFTKVNLSKSIEMCVLTFESLIYENNLKLDYEIDSDIYFNCNNDRIKQLFGILTDNAIKHAKENSKIFIKLKKNKDSICLSVKNRGEAIPKEDREKIFERFYRADKSRNRNENRYGLGLAIAKNIVSVHDGKISVSCNSGYTTFNVIFKN